jgi:hypothetical protein
VEKKVTKSKAVEKISGEIAPARRSGDLKPFGGSESNAWNTLIANQVAKCVSTIGFTEEQRKSQFEATISGLMGISPQDEIEGMIAAQMIAAHAATMECYRRAMLPQQTVQGQSEALNQANKLSRTYGALVEALNRHRGKGQQKVTVEHVHVYAGGQAVVGLVEPPLGRGRENTKDQPHAKQLTYEPQQALRSTDEEREALPVGGDAERSLPDARRSIARTTKR